MARGGLSDGRYQRDRSQSEVVGAVLVLAMTILGAVVVFQMGATVLDNAQLQSQGTSVEHAMKQLDSRMAMVALGDSTYQSVPLPDGNYRVEPDAGWIRVTHKNYSGVGTDEVLYNDTLGAIVHEEGDVVVAYQGGGVWKSTGDSSVMISPPEFHYRSSTLTLPVIGLDGSGGFSGPATAKFSAEPEVHRIYPNESETYDGGSIGYANPVSVGNVTVEVHSEYYLAWADYFRTRSEGEITVYHSNQTVRLLLLTPRTIGDFDMPSEGNGISLSQIGEEHAFDDFTITLQNEPHFENMHWAFHAEENGQQFEVHIYSPGKCTGGTYNKELDISIYFYNGSGGYYEGWQNSSIDPATSPDVEVDCSAGQMTIDLTGTSALEYKAIDLTGTDNKWYYGPEISSNDVAPTAVLDQHDVDDSGARDGTYDAGVGETDKLGFLMAHYLGRMGPTFELKVTDGPGGSDRVDEENSYGHLDYDQGGQKFVKFLHITENRVTIELD